MSERSQQRSRRPNPARRSARLAAVQALYQMDLTGGTAEQVLGEFVQHRFAGTEGGSHYGAPDRSLFTELVRGVTVRREELDEMIAGALTADWSLDRLDRVLRAILHAAAYELIARPDVPPRVIINEYVEVARAFFDGPEPRLVNGVVDRLAHILRADELGAEHEPRRGPSG